MQGGSRDRGDFLMDVRSEFAQRDLSISIGIGVPAKSSKEGVGEQAMTEGVRLKALSESAGADQPDHRFG